MHSLETIRWNWSCNKGINEHSADQHAVCKIRLNNGKWKLYGYVIRNVNKPYREIRRSMFCFHSKSGLSSIIISAESADCRTDGSGHSMSTASGSHDDLTTSWTTTVNDYNRQQAVITVTAHDKYNMVAFKTEMNSEWLIDMVSHNMTTVNSYFTFSFCLISLVLPRDAMLVWYMLWLCVCHKSVFY